MLTCLGGMYVEFGFSAACHDALLCPGVFIGDVSSILAVKIEPIPALSFAEADREVDWQ